MSRGRINGSAARMEDIFSSGRNVVPLANSTPARSCFRHTPYLRGDKNSKGAAC